ncbi:MAG: hypothetical protein AB1540_13060 [Bdellovibrionota bacterium]
MKPRFSGAEISIFCVVSLIFLNSVFQLFTDGRFSNEPGRLPIALEKPDSRTPAQSQQAPAANIDNFVPYETKCTSTGEFFQTNAAKIRIAGSLCGAPIDNRQVSSASGASEPAPAGFSEAKIENKSTNFNATVFHDQVGGKFSTDFIPLEQGKNRIELLFKYKNGKKFPFQLIVERK